MSDQTAPSTNVHTNLATDVETRSTFFVGMAGVLLLIVLVGFGPTLYLRTYFDVPEIPAYLLVHGAVLTVWFVWFLVQTSMVAVHRTDLHRQLGLIGTGIGVAVVAAGAMATLGTVSRLSGLGRDVEDTIAQFAALVWSNLGMVINFFVFLTLAILNRRRSEIHKRLMLLASISIVIPALARLGRIPIFQVGETQIVYETVAALAGLLVLLLALVLYDVRAQKRLHPVTMWGAPFVVAMPLGLALLLANTAIGQSVVRLLF